MFLQQMNSSDYNSLKTIWLMAQRDVSTLDQINMSPKTFT